MTFDETDWTIRHAIKRGRIGILMRDGLTCETELIAHDGKVLGRWFSVSYGVEGSIPLETWVGEQSQKQWQAAMERAAGIISLQSHGRLVLP